VGGIVLKLAFETQEGLNANGPMVAVRDALLRGAGLCEGPQGRGHVSERCGEFLELGPF